MNLHAFHVPLARTVRRQDWHTQQAPAAKDTFAQADQQAPMSIFVQPVITVPQGVPIQPLVQQEHMANIVDCHLGLNACAVQPGFTVPLVAWNQSPSDQQEDQPNNQPEDQQLEHHLEAESCIKSSKMMTNT